MLLHREVELDTNWEKLLLEGVEGVVTWLLTLPVPLPVPREGSTPELAGAVVVDTGVGATTVGLVMGTVVVPDEPGLGPKEFVRVGCGSGGRVRSFWTMLLTSLSTLLK